MMESGGTLIHAGHACARTACTCTHCTHALLHPHGSPAGSPQPHAAAAFPVRKDPTRRRRGMEDGGEGSTDLAPSLGYLGRSLSFPESVSRSAKYSPGGASGMIRVTSVTCPPLSVGPSSFRRWELKSNHIKKYLVWVRPLSLQGGKV